MWRRVLCCKNRYLLPQTCLSSLGRLLLAFALFILIACSIDFNKEVTLDDIMAKMLSTGFQATNVGHAIEVINNMV